MDPKRLREMRDEVLRYVYENGAHRPSFSVSGDQVQAALGLNNDEISAVVMLLLNQGLMGGGPVNGIGLSPQGQSEAERLGPRVLMKDPPAPTSVSVGYNYGIVQVAGSGSPQTASQGLDATSIAALLDRIEAEIPNLTITPDSKEEAKGALSSLRKLAVDEGSKAGARMVAAGLSDLLRQGGSSLWQSLTELFRIST